ncbi:hypothetical protein SMC26_35555 [Actinomadura fulvescens]|uniref:SH3b domain-containing protein n=1 Tax=Actinomadura fulvescens TaxID=46160 RepID=A0ABN3QL18_9ACTN
MRRRHVTFAACATVIGVLTASAVVAAPAAGMAGQARFDRVTVGDWARPFLNIREDPGGTGVPAGRVIGTLQPGVQASAECQIPDGAQITAWGRTRTDWVKIKYGWKGYAWLWGGGLNAYGDLRQC